MQVPRGSKPVNVARLECLDSYIRACIITRNGAQLVVAGEANKIVVVDVGTNPAAPVVTGRLMTPGQLTYALTATKDSRFVFSCCSEYVRARANAMQWASAYVGFKGHGNGALVCGAH